ncbi:Uncharacterized conserved protein, DUF2141 family [Flexibacter flexilis DSM 6793]|uniref:Uncharacterized conserved protein, DUF2141 family n=1 Tax=Flexibacter flexilis DSM 6793 TaxID=927664 RepID=A0A1I1L8X6_9BACT|nr:DUF2141 domain-containing protein [Flexibacter flexilis]SFC69547.1 Uncharacterized conserved protein, DUF2141 family [Flexibacter flexilis DSM 6793]
MLYSFILATFFSFQTTAAPHEPTGTIEINIQNLRNEKGQLLISVYRQADGFPNNPAKTYITKSISVSTLKSPVRFESLPYGTYAISFLHDENGNHRMDYNLLGMPQEGYAVSGQSMSLFSLPRYEKAKFELNVSHQKLLISMYYLR